MAYSFISVPLRSSNGHPWQAMYRCEVVINDVQKMLFRHGVIALDISTQTGCILRPTSKGKHIYIYIYSAEERYQV